MKRLALGILVSLTCMSGFAASFDCAKARSASERIVCDDLELSESDERLAALVLAAKKRAADPRAFQREQDNAWVRRQKCKDAACVRTWYAGRIAALSDQAPVPVPEAKPAVAAASPPKPAPPPTPAPVPKATPAPATPAPPPKAAPAPVPRPAPIPAPPVAAKPAVVPAPVPVPKLAEPAKAPVPAAATPAPAAAAAATPDAQFQSVGDKLGFEIPATKADFLARYSKTGGQCGVSKSLNSLKAVARAAVSDCWSGNQCPAYSKEVSCKVVRTAYDDTGRMVLFMATLNTVSNDTAKSTRDMGVVVRKFSGMSGTSPIVRKLRSGHMLALSGFDGALRFDADVMAAQGEQQIGMFWVSLR